jgi:hypothetical protein
VCIIILHVETERVSEHLLRVQVPLALILQEFFNGTNPFSRNGPDLREGFYALHCAVVSMGRPSFPRSFTYTTKAFIGPARVGR